MLLCLSGSWNIRSQQHWKCSRQGGKFVNVFTDRQYQAELTQCNSAEWNNSFTRNNEWSYCYEGLLDWRIRLGHEGLAWKLVLEAAIWTKREWHQLEKAEKSHYLREYWQEFKVPGRRYGKFSKPKWCFSSYKNFFKSMKRTVENRELLFNSFSNRKVLKRRTCILKTEMRVGEVWQKAEVSSDLGDCEESH